jgi:hypothetical protein
LRTAAHHRSGADADVHDGIQAVHICAAIEESAARNEMVFPRGPSLKQDGG